MTAGVQITGSGLKMQPDRRLTDVDLHQKFYIPCL